MINLDERYHSYLANENKFLTIDGSKQNVKGYGWTDDGSKIVGYYILTDDYKLLYNLDEQFESMEELN